MGWTTGVQFPTEERNLPTPNSAQNPASYPIVTGGSFPGRAKRPRYEADQSPPYTFEIKNGGAITPLPHTSSWCGALLVKPGTNLFF
jgi:hypothetical protein